MSRISLDERTSKSRGTTIIVSYGSKMWMRQPSIYSSPVTSVRNAGNIYWETDLDFLTLMERARQQHTTAFFMEIFIL
jgi:hypothetical protein